LPPIRSRFLSLFALLVWVGFIFGTSCTVILPKQFFGLIEKFTGAGRESMQGFIVFWGIARFAVVKGWHFTEFAIPTWLTSAAPKLVPGRNNSPDHTAVDAALHAVCSLR
jgi:hypothetical protein